MLRRRGDKSAPDQASATNQAIVIEQGRRLIREQERREQERSNIEPRSVDLFH